MFYYMHVLKSHTDCADLDKLLDLNQTMIQIITVKHRWRELAEAMRLPETLIEQVSQIKV